ncbi:hypothetical protein SAMN05444396_11043 [Flavobacterium segetis]|uniref:Uncharacterized protein n=1 Tax=Flavobacterium segetis TaxID=271157 RepID=A0A1M5JA71_9FLAO|nr:hypothetical protein [Flavobacterium segetis]SHG37462.1 hypothetical protein SAMN05444396_11043 [Flavobacterium segetis]
MKYIFLKTNYKNLVKGILLFVFIVASNSAAVAQTSKNLTAEIEVKTELKSDNVSVNSSSASMNFVMWFMGSKQNANSNISSDSTNTKKQVIMSGTAPNRLLIKAFLKKAINLDSMIA